MKRQDLLSTCCLNGREKRAIVEVWNGSSTFDSRFLCYIQPCPISSSAMDWTVLCQNIEALTPIAIVFGDGFKERFQDNGGGGSDPLWLVSLSGETKDAHREERLDEDMGRRYLSTSQEEKSHQKPNLLSPWSWPSSLWNCKKIRFCCFSFPVYGVLWWQLSRSMHHVSNTLQPDSCGMECRPSPQGVSVCYLGLGRTTPTAVVETSKHFGQWGEQL